MKILDEFNIQPNNEKLFEDAFTHGSCVDNGSGDYEILEFLGDSVLSLVVSEYLYKKYPGETEGSLTKLRANYVCQAALIYYCQDIGLNNYLHICIKENNITPNEVLAIYADIVESFIGALFIDQGIEKVKEFAAKYIFNHIDDKKIFFNDYKSKIKEYCDANNKKVIYEVVFESGIPHDKTFIIKILINDIEYGRGTGKNKKEAQQNAAFIALKKIGIVHE